MAVFRYKAVTNAGEVRAGLVEAADAPDARLRLRGDDLRVVQLYHTSGRAVKRQTGRVRLIDRWLRSRRSEPRASFYEAVSTLLQSGLSLRRSLAVLGEGRRINTSVKRLVCSLESDVASGRSFEEALRSRPGWFDGLDAALVAAAIRQGELSPALERLAARHRQTSELRTKVVAALSYPLLVLVVTTVVVVILSTRTLPPIVAMLADAEIAVPALTSGVMQIGSLLASPMLLIAVTALVPTMIAAWLLARRWAEHRIAPTWIAKRTPRFLVMTMLASLARSIADLTSTGLPLTESVRVAAPTLRGPCASHLRATLQRVCDRLEQGDDLADAFDDGVWFDPEFHRLLAVGQDAGELPEMLRRLADRNESEARRAVDRLASLLEPAAILMMSALVGTVVLAALLPLIRMQELI